MASRTTTSRHQNLLPMYSDYSVTYVAGLYRLSRPTTPAPAFGLRRLLRADANGSVLIERQL